MERLVYTVELLCKDTFSNPKYNIPLLCAFQDTSLQCVCDTGESRV